MTLEHCIIIYGVIFIIWAIGGLFIAKLISKRFTRIEKHLKIHDDRLYHLCQESQYYRQMRKSINDSLKEIYDRIAFSLIQTKPKYSGDAERPGHEEST